MIVQCKVMVDKEYEKHIVCISHTHDTASVGSKPKNHRFVDLIERGRHFFSESRYR